MSGCDGSGKVSLYKYTGFCVPIKEKTGEETCDMCGGDGKIMVKEEEGLRLYTRVKDFEDEKNLECGCCEWSILRV